ncbi:MAG: aminotransferase class V-fold PLP-dependent enzyme [Elusimicrobiota bacterium]
MLDDARCVLSAFVGAEPEGLVFVANATAGLNAVLRSVKLAPGDEVLLIDHCYESARWAARIFAERAGAKAVFAPVPFPPGSEDAVMEAVLAGVSPKTRLAVLDHVTSPTALVLPIRRLVRELAAKGVDTLVDGAHAPGMLELDIRQIGAAYYTGNCHKWMCAPKGAAFLHVREDRREGVLPTSVSKAIGWLIPGRSRFHNLFDWQGTFDPTAWLCVPLAVSLMGSLHEGGWPELRRRNHELAVRGRAIVCRALGVPEAPDPGMLGSMAAIPLPVVRAELPPPEAHHHPLQDALLRSHGIEVPVILLQDGRLLLRISAQAYNREEEYVRLAEALREILA